MNTKLIGRILSVILFIELLFMLPPLFLCVYDGDACKRSFIFSMLILFVLSFVLRFLNTDDLSLSPKEGLVTVSLSWVLCSFFGALPFVFAGKLDLVDAFFETVSGFTTTGASVISDIESYPRALVMWRSMTHWIGGMGILVFTIGLLPKLGVSGFQIFKAESPGPEAGKIESTISESAKRLYGIYMVITIVLFILLILGGMSVFDSFVHTMGVVGTGGFSSKNDSITSYNGFYIPIVMSIFMIMCGTNFTIYYQLYRKKFKEALKNEEVRVFYFIIIAATVLIGLDLMTHSSVSPAIAFRDSLFQVTSIASTSGFANVDYDLWPNFSKYILLVLYFFGSCAGSTAGGMKIIRILVVFKLVKREIKKSLHPNAVLPVTVNGKALSDEVVFGICGFLGIYFIIFAISVAVVSASGQDLLTSISSVVTMLSNVGPGFGNVGPTLNFQFFSNFYKIYFSALMLLGRLEFFTILAIIMPKRMKRERFI